MHHVRYKIGLVLFFFSYSYYSYLEVRVRKGDGTGENRSSNFMSCVSPNIIRVIKM